MDEAESELIALRELKARLLPENLELKMKLAEVEAVQKQSHTPKAIIEALLADVSCTRVGSACHTLEEKMELFDRACATLMPDVILAVVFFLEVRGEGGMYGRGGFVVQSILYPG